jgi:hypothetical protein
VAPVCSVNHAKRGTRAAAAQPQLHRRLHAQERASRARVLQHGVQRGARACVHVHVCLAAAFELRLF